MTDKVTKIEECHWRGRPISELTREELYGVILHLHQELQDERKFHRQSLDLFSVGSR